MSIKYITIFKKGGEEKQERFGAWDADREKRFELETKILSYIEEGIWGKKMK